MKVQSALAILFLPSVSLGADFFQFQGSVNRATGGAGIIWSSGGPAVIHNPAGINGVNRHVMDFDLGLSNIKLDITPPPEQAEPGTIEIPVAPLMSFGGSYRPEGSNFSFAYIAIPLGGGGVSTKNSGIPAKNLINNDFITVDATAEKDAHRIGLGASWQGHQKIKLGFSAIYYQDNLATVASNEDFSSDQKISYEMTYNEYLFGLKYQASDNVFLSGTYQPSVIPRYKLKIDIGQGEQVSDGFDYRPTKFGLGLRVNLNKYLTTFIQYTRELWEEGTVKGRPPLASILGVVPVEFLNTSNVVMGFRYQDDTKNRYFFAFSHFPANKGEGLSDENGDVVLTGFSADDFEGLNRQHLAFGYQRKLKSRLLTAYLNYISAQNKGTLGSPGEGEYKLRVILLGSGLRF